MNYLWWAARTLTNCLDSGSERVDKIGPLCSDGWRSPMTFHSEELSHVEPTNYVEP